MAIELIDKIKQKNGGLFKLVDAIDVEMKDGRDVEAVITEHIENHPSGDSCVYEGDEPPDDTTKLWVSNDNIEIEADLNNPVLDELISIISSMKSRIDKLEEEVEYLKENGVTPPIPTLDYAILTEGGDMITTEDGDNIILEEGV